jgi:hypothetical protein
MHNHAPHLTAIDRTALCRTANVTHRIDVNGSHEKIHKVVTASTQCYAELRGKHKKWSFMIESIDRWQNAPGRRTCGCRTRIRKRKQVSTLLPLGRPRSVKAKIVKTKKCYPRQDIGWPKASYECRTLKCYPRQNIGWPKASYECMTLKMLPSQGKLMLAMRGYGLARLLKTDPYDQILVEH